MRRRFSYTAVVHKREVKTVSGYGGGRGSGFALIVVLFILLIIVGAFYWN